jgi:uncharacterized small protein (DUF1192 family)
VWGLDKQIQEYTLTNKQLQKDNKRQEVALSKCLHQHKSVEGSAVAMSGGVPQPVPASFDREITNIASQHSNPSRALQMKKCKDIEQEITSITSKIESIQSQFLKTADTRSTNARKYF